MLVVLKVTTIATNQMIARVSGLRRQMIKGHRVSNGDGQTLGLLKISFKAKRMSARSWLLSFLTNPWMLTVLLTPFSMSPFTLPGASIVCCFNYHSRASPPSSFAKHRLWQSKNDASESIFCERYRVDQNDPCPCANGNNNYFMDHKSEAYISSNAIINECQPENNRRRMIANVGKVAAVISLAGMPMPSQAAKLLDQKGADAVISALTAPMVEVPLEFIPTINGYVVRYNLFNEEFAAIVDTGSPFLTVPYYCKPYHNQKMRWGCYRPERTLDSGYGNTIEGFDGNFGTVVWRKADFSFAKLDLDNNEITTTNNAESSPLTISNEGNHISDENKFNRPGTVPLVFGVLSEDLLNRSGGVFFGLIKETDKSIRPSFLGQTGYTSFCVDLKHSNNTNSKSMNSPKLTLSKQPIIGSETLLSQEEKKDFIPLVRDLKKRYGAPVVHYTAKASQFVVNGLPLLIDQRRPLYVIFDTGVSGMVVSQELYDGRYKTVHF